jgi:hypothetical protein
MSFTLNPVFLVRVPKPAWLGSDDHSDKFSVALPFSEPFYDVSSTYFVNSGSHDLMSLDWSDQGRANPWNTVGGD